MSQHKPLVTKPDDSHSDVEHIKYESRYLRANLKESLLDPITGGLPTADERVLKFHGSYMQDDRDLRNERTKQKLEPAYQFMVRVCAPGRCRHAETMAGHGRTGAQVRQRFASADDPSGVPDARHFEVESEVDDSRNQ